MGGSEEAGDDPNMGIVGGAVGGIIFIVIVAAIILFVIWRKGHRKGRIHFITIVPLLCNHPSCQDEAVT